MSIEENKALIQRFIDQLCNHGPEVAGAIIDELVAPGYVHRSNTTDGSTRDQYRANIRRYHLAFPDMRVSINDLIAEGDKVVARLTLSGTYLGAAMEHAPTGNHVRFTSTIIYRLADGQIQEDCENWNSQSLAR